MKPTKKAPRKQSQTRGVVTDSTPGIKNNPPSVEQLAIIAAAFMCGRVNPTNRDMMFAARDAMQLWDMCSFTLKGEIDYKVKLDGLLKKLEERSAQYTKAGNDYMKQEGIKPLQDAYSKMTWSEAAKYIFPNTSSPKAAGRALVSAIKEARKNDWEKHWITLSDASFRRDGLDNKSINFVMCTLGESAAMRKKEQTNEKKRSTLKQYQSPKNGADKPTK